MTAPTPTAAFRSLFCAVLAALVTLAPARAADDGAYDYVTTVTTISYEYDADDSGDFGDIEDGEALKDAALPDDGTDITGMQRYAATVPPRLSAPALAQYGPFRVVDAATAEMAGDVDSDTPARFTAMLRAHPGLKTLRMIDCPGSVDDAANLALSRQVRRAGLATHVPAGGSVRSGAVELFLAGTTRTAEYGAEFGVHSWRDEDGREARDYPASDPVHREYLNYYREMGMDDARAREFYAFTNRASFDDVHYMSAAELAKFGLLDRPTPVTPVAAEKPAQTLAFAYLLD